MVNPVLQMWMNVWMIMADVNKFASTLRGRMSASVMWDTGSHPMAGAVTEVCRLSSNDRSCYRGM